MKHQHITDEAIHFIQQIDAWLLLRDEDANGTYDRLEPGKSFVITHAQRSGNSFSLTWQCFPGRSYKIQASDSLAPGAWSDVPNSLVIAAATALSASHQVALETADLQRFFRVAVVPE